MSNDQRMTHGIRRYRPDCWTVTDAVDAPRTPPHELINERKTVCKMPPLRK